MSKVLTNKTNTISPLPNNKHETGNELVRYLSVISHEIRTPLHAIMGLTELLGDEVNTEAGHRLLNKIENASYALLQILNTSIDAGRAKESHLSIQMEECELQSVLERITSTFSLNAEFKGVSLSLRMDPRLIGRKLLTDCTRVQQILSNLVGNAVKFTDQGEIHVWATIRQETDTSLELLIIVEDSGVGIEERYLKSIFEPFEQVALDQSGRPQGSGLGLYICKELAELLGGELKVSSTPNVGSRFQLSFSVDKPDNSRSDNLIKLSSSEKIAVVGPENVSSEVIIQLLQGLEGRVDYFNSLTPELFEHSYALTIVHSHMTKEQPDQWTKLQRVRTTNQLVLQCDEMDVDFKKPEGVRCWYQPYLPSDLIAFCKSAGVIEGPFSNAQSFTNSAVTSLRPEISILCVDDSPTNLIVLNGALLKAGYSNVTMAKDGQDAVDKFIQNKKIDLVLMDYNMPKLNGIEAAEKIKDIDPEVKIICLTALSAEEVSIVKTRDVFDSIMTKPANVLQIESQVNELFEQTV